MISDNATPQALGQPRSVRLGTIHCDRWSNAQMSIEIPTDAIAVANIRN